MKRYLFCLIILIMILSGCASTINVKQVDAKLISEDLNNPTDSKQAKDYYNAGTKLLLEQKYEESIEKFLYAVQFDPGYTDAMDHLGIAYRRIGNLKKAEEWYLKSLEIMPTNTLALTNLALVYRGMNKNEKAITYLCKSIAIDKEYPESYYGMGELYFTEGMYGESIPFIEKALYIYGDTKSPYIFDASYLLSVSLYNIGDWENALSALEFTKKKYLNDNELDKLIKSCKENINKLSEDKKILRYIDLISKNPISDLSKDYYSLIMNYGMESKDLKINISETYVPWLGKIGDEKWESYLLVSYIAGNMKSQLLGNIGNEDPISGIEFALKTYSKIKGYDINFTNEELEKLLDLLETGNLENYLN